MANYNATSPYFTTPYSQFYLDNMVNRPIPKENDDNLIKLNQTYQYRPDLLAYDLSRNLIYGGCFINAIPTR